MEPPATFQTKAFSHLLREYICAHKVKWLRSLSLDYTDHQCVTWWKSKYVYKYVYAELIFTYVQVSCFPVPCPRERCSVRGETRRMQHRLLLSTRTTVSPRKGLGSPPSQLRREAWACAKCVYFVLWCFICFCFFRFTYPSIFIDTPIFVLFIPCTYQWAKPQRRLKPLARACKWAVSALEQHQEITTLQPLKTEHRRKQAAGGSQPHGDCRCPWGSTCQQVVTEPHTPKAWLKLN